MLLHYRSPHNYHVYISCMYYVHNSTILPPISGSTIAPPLILTPVLSSGETREISKEFFSIPIWEIQRYFERYVSVVNDPVDIPGNYFLPVESPPFPQVETLVDLEMQPRGSNSSSIEDDVEFRKEERQSELCCLSKEQRGWNRHATRNRPGWPWRAILFLFITKEAFCDERDLEIQLAIPRRLFFKYSSSFSSFVVLWETTWMVLIRVDTRSSEKRSYRHVTRASLSLLGSPLLRECFRLVSPIVSRLQS